MIKPRHFESLTLIVTLILSLCASVNTTNSSAFDIPKLFTEELIIPDVIPVPPRHQVRLFYPWGELQPGGNLTFNQSAIIPNCSWPYEENTYYTLFLTGITDWKPAKERAPGYQQNVHGQEWHQWLVTNIPGDEVDEGDTVYSYLRVGDPVNENTRDLSLVLVYKQRGRLQINTSTEGGWCEFQRDYRPYRLARRYRLGHPVAGTYYMTYYEPYKGEYDDCYY